ncbi:MULTISPECIES: ABC-three component system protein [Snodgrassella]|uniref:ABC-three component system protein n=1 Tax=Snodgrassella TaxID=1193515 RepID=UPI0008160CFE|nr:MULTISPECIES: ABC-three component system protein [Snodgrassella]MCO6513441.1 hypothetical protein [Snodgrassella sp.]SCB86028.1 hypothetical protein GA0061082_102234 [Snodgrassella sp. R-53583]
MDQLTKQEVKRSAAASVTGYDYQFLYFLFLALELRKGQKIGFEIKDDIHIEKEDGSIILLQLKHSINKANGKVKNMATLNDGFWDTLSSWLNLISFGLNLEKYSFVLVTNMNENGNEFIKQLSNFQKTKNIDVFKEYILNIKTKNQTILDCIDKIKNLDIIKLKLFFLNLSIDLGVDNLIKKIEDQILYMCRKENFVEAIFDKYYSNISKARYFDIKNRKEFIITFDDFTTRFGNCMDYAFNPNQLPIREPVCVIPDNLENQIFIRQLLDIEYIQPQSEEILDLTFKKLKMIDNVFYWVRKGMVSQSDIEQYDNNCIDLCNTKSKRLYREITKKLNQGISIDELDNEIKHQAITLVDELHEEYIGIPGHDKFYNLVIHQGHLYALSDELRIGWHYDWQNRYKKS